jgi:uncharacterized protein (TIGR03435 family)
MLQTLLAERFKLVLHREAKSIESYVLEVGKNGPKLESGKGGDSKTDNGRGDISAINATMDRLAEILSRQTDLPVINHTGLDGVFNVRLHWIPENTKPTTAPDTISTEGPSIFTAVQEQLGLRLRAGKASVNVLVIDHAERPTEN